MLNLGLTQVRNVHPGFQQGQTEAEKQQQQVSWLDEFDFPIPMLYVPYDFPSFACSEFIVIHIPNSILLC
jgi:hypothetical protein